MSGIVSSIHINMITYICVLNRSICMPSRVNSSPLTPPPPPEIIPYGKRSLEGIPYSKPSHCRTSPGGGGGGLYHVVKLPNLLSIFPPHTHFMIREQITWQIVHPEIIPYDKRSSWRNTIWLSRYYISIHHPPPPPPRGKFCHGILFGGGGGFPYGIICPWGSSAMGFLPRGRLGLPYGGGGKKSHRWGTFTIWYFIRGGRDSMGGGGVKSHVTPVFHYLAILTLYSLRMQQSHSMQTHIICTFWDLDQIEGTKSPGKLQASFKDGFNYVLDIIEYVGCIAHNRMKKFPGEVYVYDQIRLYEKLLCVCKRAIMIYYMKYRSNID